MRPLQPRTKARAPRAAGTKTKYPPTLHDEEMFRASKRDKQRIKHSILLSKVQKSSDKPSGIRKRRRPTKKLVTNLNALADALPEIVAPARNGIISIAGPVLRSLRSKPGVSKKKSVLDTAEKRRFGQNLAILSQARAAEEQGRTDASTTTEGGTSARVNRWAALRQHIAGSMGNIAGSSKD